MDDAWVRLAAWCGAEPLGGGLGLGIFLIGAAGSVTHCAPMCGGFVLGQVADRMARLPGSRLCEWRRLEAAALVPYHLGRLTTYAALGAAAGAGGAFLGRVPYLSSVLLALGAILFLSMAARHGPAWLRLFHIAPPRLGGWMTRLVPRPRQTEPTPLATYWLGVCLGFLPCGLLYSALAIAMAAGDPRLGALAMVAFGLGTVPALVAVAVAGSAAGVRWGRLIAQVAPLAMLANAAFLILLAVRGFVLG
jgi:sulfite exporter TauE/SafE